MFSLLSVSQSNFCETWRKGKARRQNKGLALLKGTLLLMWWCRFTDAQIRCNEIKQRFFSV